MDNPMINRRFILSLFSRIITIIRIFAIIFAFSVFLNPNGFGNHPVEQKQQSNSGCRIIKHQFSGVLRHDDPQKDYCFDIVPNKNFLQIEVVANFSLPHGHNTGVWLSIQMCHDDNQLYYLEHLDPFYYRADLNRFLKDGQCSEYLPNNNLRIRLYRVELISDIQLRVFVQSSQMVQKESFSISSSLWTLFKIGLQKLLNWLRRNRERSVRNIVQHVNRMVPAG